jgi:serine/threonine-protein kinase
VAQLLARVREALAPRYEVKDELGHGGMATVFRARDTRSGTDVAIKVLRPELAATVEVARFEREIAILTRLRHPHVLPVLDSGETSTFLYFAMPYAQGDTLRMRLEQLGALPIDTTLDILSDVAQAIDHAHGNNIIHRDIKPENIVFDGGRSLVCDFGVGRAIESASGDRLSSSGIVVGTPYYMSPEQGAGAEDLTGAVDIYALACVTYEMLTGEMPFTGVNPQAVIARHVAEQPRSIRIVRSEVPEAMERAILWAMQKDPTTRPATAGEFATAMGRRQNPSRSHPMET